MTAIRYLLASSLLLAACSTAKLAPVTVGNLEFPAGLALVDADTPYFLVTTKGPQGEALEVALKQQAAWFENIARTTDKQFKEYSGIVRRIADIMKDRKFAENGILANARMLIYGLGPMPVLRVELADVKRFDALLLDLLGQSQLEWQAREVGGQVLRSVGVDKDVMIIALYHNDDLVLALAPVTDLDIIVASVTGAKRPTNPLVGSQRLANVLAEKASGDSLWMVGDVSPIRLVDGAFFGEPTLASIAGMRKKAGERFLSRERHELRYWSGAINQASMKVSFNAKGRIAYDARLQLHPAFKPVLAALPASIAGAEAQSEAPFQFAFASDLKGLVDTLPKALTAYREATKGLGYTLEVAQKQDPTGQDKSVKPPHIIGKTPDLSKIPAEVLGPWGLRLAILGADFDALSPLALVGSLRLALILRSPAMDAMIAKARRIPQVKQPLDGFELPDDGTPASLNGRIPLPGLDLIRVGDTLALTYGGGVAQKVAGWLKAPAAAPSLMASSVHMAFLGPLAKWGLANTPDRKDMVEVKNALKQLQDEASRSPNSVLSYRLVVEGDAMVLRGDNFGDSTAN